MYSWSNEPYLKKGFKIVTDTVEGEEPMRHKQLSIKKVSKDEASDVIVEVIVCRSKEASQRCTPSSDEERGGE